MNIGGIIGVVIAALVLGLIIFMVIRTAMNKPQKMEKVQIECAEIDKSSAVQHLQEAIRIKTVSMVEEYVDNTQPFYDFQAWLKKTYPLLHKNSELTVIENFSLIYHIKGKDPSLKGGCYLAHIDVVPAPSDGWEHEPFGGELTEDGYIYGRGAQDMKGHMIALLEAIEFHLKNGKQFNRDLYLCFGHDEEPGTSTNGASSIVRYLKNKGVEMEFVVDEGGTVLDGKLLGIPHTVALIGACEKGNGDLELVVKKSGGHASNPKNPTAVGVLSKAVYKVESHPMKTRWTNMSKEMLRSLSPYCNPVFKFVFTNRDILSPLLKFILTKAAPMTNALVRTTFAPTMLWGSDARNVIPTEVKANINYRMITGETADDVKKYLEKLLGKQVEVNLLAYSNPSPEADVHCSAYQNISKSITEVFDDIVVAPYPFIAASDARFYNPLTDNVFRFGPFINSLDDQARIHGRNERLHVDQLEKAIQFFVKCFDNTLN